MRAFNSWGPPAVTSRPATGVPFGLKDIVAHECRGFGLDVPTLAVEPGRAISGRR